MPKKFYGWEVSIWSTVWHKQDAVWVWSHTSSKTIVIRAETEAEVRYQAALVLESEYVDEKNRIKVSAQQINSVCCMGRMKKVTEWQVTNREDVPKDYRWRY
jgi:hypothetical protein